MSNDYDKQLWQAEQAARDAALEKQREKERKSRERAARNAQRKLERLQRTLSDQGEISDFESEFAQSVTERLEQFGSAFRDLEKGRPGDALSFAQKRVVAGMNRKAKDLKRQASQARFEPNPADEERPLRKPFAKRSSFKSKRQSYTPRVRQLDETFEGEAEMGRADPLNEKGDDPAVNARPPVGKPFLRIVGKS